MTSPDDDQLIERLRRYRPTLDAAVGHARTMGPGDRHSRSRSNVLILEVAASVVAGIAGLAALTFIGQDNESAGSDESVVTMAAPDPDPSLLEASVPPTQPPADPVGTMLPAYPGFPALPHFVLTDGRLVPLAIELRPGDPNPSEQAVTITYLLTDGDGVLRTVHLGSFNNASDVGNSEDGQPALVKDLPARLSATETTVGVTWLASGSNAVSVEIEGGTSDEVLALAETVSELNNEERSAYIDGIQLDPLPEPVQAWRDAQIAAGIPPVRVYAYG